MKKKVIFSASAAVLALLLLLFFPVPRGTMNDGGSREYNALTYKLVVWNRINLVQNPNGNVSDHEARFRKTSVYWYPDNLKSIDELWKIECSGR